MNKKYQYKEEAIPLLEYNTLTESKQNVYNNKRIRFKRRCVRIYLIHPGTHRSRRSSRHV